MPNPMIPKPKRKAPTPVLASSVSTMEHVMIDLETLGNRPGCAILSIGAVAFDPRNGQLGPELYVVASRVDQAKMPLLHESADTLKWWLSQAEAARQVLDEADKKTALPLEKALAQLTNFLDKFGLKRVKVWGNGSDFDNAILSCCYNAVGLPVPWEYWNNRCYRTLKNLVPSEKPKRTGVYHNALDDAKTQALHAVELLRRL